MSQITKLFPCLLAYGVFLMSSSCISLFKSESEKDSGYEVASLPKPWQASDPGGADLLFVNKEAGASIALNSVCRQYQSLSLETLMQDLKKRLGDTEDIASSSFILSGYPALQNAMHAKIDDQDLLVILTVARSRDCVYDFTLASSRESSEAMRLHYDQFLKSFSKKD